MARSLAVMGFVLALSAAPAVFAKDHEDHGRGHHSVPELSAAGAAGGLVVVGAAVAIVVGRRRKRKS
jgi:uncharacterized membrane protein